MIAVVVGVVAFAAAAAAWARFSTGRAERHSVKSYEHALDVLGDVAKRGESVAPVQTPNGAELARPHVRPSSAPDRVRPLLKSEGVPPARVRLRPPSRAGQEPAISGAGQGPAMPADPPASPAPALSPRGEDPEVVVQFDDLPAAPKAGTRQLTKRSAPRKGSDNFARRAATGAAAAAVLGALGVGGWQLAMTRANTPHPSPPPPQTGKSHTKTTQPTVPPSNALPSNIVPTSESATLVSYTVPSPSYTISFHSTGACWLGIQREIHGPYLWMQTLAPNTSANYPTQGATVVYIGAPDEISISVNGIPVTLPSGGGYNNPYRVALTPQSAPST